MSTSSVWAINELGPHKYRCTTGHAWETGPGVGDQGTLIVTVGGMQTPPHEKICKRCYLELITALCGRVEHADGEVVEQYCGTVDEDTGER